MTRMNQQDVNERFESYVMSDFTTYERLYRAHAEGEIPYLVRLWIEIMERQIEHIRHSPGPQCIGNTLADQLAVPEVEVVTARLLARFDEIAKGQEARDGR